VLATDGLLRRTSTLPRIAAVAVRGGGAAAATAATAAAKPPGAPAPGSPAAGLAARGWPTAATPAAQPVRYCDRSLRRGERANVGAGGESGGRHSARARELFGVTGPPAPTHSRTRWAIVAVLPAATEPGT
jgi:hypothetical protein